MIKKYVLFFVTVVFFAACSDEEPQGFTPPKYDRGVFVVNQGNFGAGTGTITFSDQDTLVEQDVFQRNNMGDLLGNVAQSIIKAGNNYFIAINNSRQVIMVNSINFSRVRDIFGLSLPRYFTSFRNEFVFLSEWGVDGKSGKVHKLDRESGEILHTTSTMGGPEEMAIINQKLYIAKSGGFGSDSLLLEYDIPTDMIQESYVVGHNPVDIEVEDNRKLWILCSGLFDFDDPAGNTPGALVEWRNGEILQSIPLDNGADNLTMDRSNGILYFTMSGKIMKFNTRTDSDPEVFYDGSFYALEVDPNSGDLYAADAKDFTSNGEVLILGSNGQVKDRFPTGVIPGFIYFAR